MEKKISTKNSSKKFNKQYYLQKSTYTFEMLIFYKTFIYTQKNFKIFLNNSRETLKTMFKYALWDILDKITVQKSIATLKTHL